MNNVAVCLRILVYSAVQSFKVVNPSPKKELLQLATDKVEGKSRRSNRGQSTPMSIGGTYPTNCLHFHDNAPYLYVMAKMFETRAHFLNLS